MASLRFGLLVLNRVCAQAGATPRVVTQVRVLLGPGSPAGVAATAFDTLLPWLQGPHCSPGPALESLFVSVRSYLLRCAEDPACAASVVGGLRVLRELVPAVNGTQVVAVSAALLRGMLAFEEVVAACLAVTCRVFEWSATVMVPLLGDGSAASDSGPDLVPTVDGRAACRAVRVWADQVRLTALVPMQHPGLAVASVKCFGKAAAVLCEAKGLAALPPEFAGWVQMARVAQKCPSVLAEGVCEEVRDADAVALELQGELSGAHRVTAKLAAAWPCVVRVLKRHPTPNVVGWTAVCAAAFVGDFATQAVVLPDVPTLCEAVDRLLPPTTPATRKAVARFLWFVRQWEVGLGPVRVSHTVQLVVAAACTPPP